MATETYSRHLLRMARRRAGFTQHELAQRAGTSQPAISAYESGRRSPSVETLTRIIAAAGFEVRMRISVPDTHQATLAVSQRLLPETQVSAHEARVRKRVDADTT